MIQAKAEIEHKQLAETLVATTRFTLHKRGELPAVLAELQQQIPPDQLAGPALCIFHFVSSVTEGSDAEVGFPVTRPVETGAVKTRVLPAMEVLSLTHRGPLEELGESYRQGCMALPRTTPSSRTSSAGRSTWTGARWKSSLWSTTGARCWLPTWRGC